MKNCSTLKNLGRNIRTIRKDKGLSQENLALEAEVDRAYLGRVERGERNITILSLTKITEALDVSLSQLFKGVEDAA